MTPKDFIGAMLPGALACQGQYKIPAGFTIAQAACESAWGTKAPGNNLFGEQALGGWTGATVDESTHEYVKGVKTLEVEKFRAYPNWAAAIADHGKFLTENHRYAGCFSTDDSVEFARRVAAAGYSTSPTYAATLESIINSHNLTQYDKRTPSAS